MNGLGGVNFKIAKTMFFDRPVAKGIDKAARTVLSRFGAFVRRTSKGSLKRARQKTKGEMTDEETRSYNIRASIAKREGKPRPRRPEQISKPGEPPRLHMRPRSPLRELIFFVYDPREKAVLIGPTASNAQTNGEATQALEHGGISRIRGRRRRVRARPNMRPAFDKNLSKLREWKNSIK